MIRTVVSATALAALAALLLAAAPAPASELKVVAPPDGAVLGEAKVTLIGSGASGALEVSLNGKRVEGIKQSGKAFTGPLQLAAGKNVLLVKSGPESHQYAFEFRAKDPEAKYYRYHDPVSGGECKECHPQGVGRTSPVTEAKLCTACHDPKTGKKYLHGPLGAGQCSICHDPHGSSYPAFLVASSRALCMQCHAQSRSQQHIERSANKQCPECHDPHSSDKQYLLH